MTPIVTRLALGALLALPSAGLARAEDAPKKPGAVAYPSNPDGTPAASATGGNAPLAAKPACPQGKCADSPGAPAQADAQGAGAKPAAPSAAYPDAPVKTPAAETSDGTAPKP